ncbi:MAG: hypothetical protein QOK28_3553 [Actinomycetota bacterium]
MSRTYDPLVPVVYLVSGIPGAGKTTISRALAQRLGPRAVALEGDVLSFDFVILGVADPSDVEEWEEQMKLRRTHLALLAQSFADAGFNVVIDDVVVAKSALASYSALDPQPQLIVLAPSLETVRHRDANRDKQVFAMWSHLDEELRSNLAEDGTWIDSSDLTVDETVDAILAMNHASRASVFKHHGSTMREYLLRTERGEWPAVHRDRLADVLTPRGFDCAPVPGNGDYRFRLGDAEVSFSGEAEGWHLCIEGTLGQDDETHLLNVVQHQVEAEVSEICEWTQLG